MAPTRGLTPIIRSPGLKRYVHLHGDGSVSWAWWSDSRERVPVTRGSWREWLDAWAGLDGEPGRGL
jgi:hypothetical protein